MKRPWRSRIVWLGWTASLAFWASTAPTEPAGASSPGPPDPSPSVAADGSPPNEASPVDWPREDPAQPMGYTADVFTRSLAFYLNFRRSAVPEGHLPHLEIKRPDGSTFEADEIHEGEVYHGRRLEPFATRMVTVEQPEPGFWSVLVDGQAHLPSDDFEMQYLLDVDRPLTLEPRLAYTADCAPCWIFEAFLDDGDIATEHLQARGWISRLIEETDDGQRFGDAWNLTLVDDGQGYDRVAGDGRFTSRPWSPPADEVVMAGTEMIGMADGHPFFRRAHLDDQGWTENLVSLPPLVPQRDYDLVPDPRVAQAFADDGFPLPSPLGTFRFVRFTPDGDADITWPAPLDERVAMVFLYDRNAGSPARLSDLGHLMLSFQATDLLITVQPAP